LNYIIYDIEATCWDGAPLADIQEVIEIGAILLNDYGEEVGSYNRFVRPKVSPTLSPFCKRLTTITQENVDRANTFPKVIEEFQDWAEMFDEDYILCSWGDFDKEIFISNCELHDLDYDWAEKHINLKKQYREIKNNNRQVGFKAALKYEGFEFTGTEHRGISDAENLVKIFTKYLDEWVCI